MFYIIGLGNPGEEYHGSRHNTGREAVKFFAKQNDLENFKPDKKSKSLISKSKEIICILPETFMNKSGVSASYFIKSRKAAENLIVVYDDIDLPLGTIKISFNKGSGGHNGLESIIKAVKTKEFVRIRVGVSPATPSGKIKKPIGEKKVIDFILSKFKHTEEAVLKKMYKKSAKAINVIIEEGKDVAMNRYN